LRPTRSRSGQRTYTQNDIRKIRQIKHLLYDLKFTIEGAKKALRDGGAAQLGVVTEAPAAPVQALPQAQPLVQPLAQAKPVAPAPPPVEPPPSSPGMQEALVEVRREAAEFLVWLDGQAAT